MDTTDQILVLLKYSGAIIAAVYGVYATVTDFHEHRGGRKILSKKGYVGLALLIVSALLSVSADVLKDAREARQAKEARDELVKNYDKIIGDLKHVADAAARAANPIKDVTVSFCFQIPLQHLKLQQYRERLERDVPRLIQEGQLAVSRPMTDHGPTEEVLFRRESALFPDETESLALDVLSIIDLELNFYRDVPSPSDGRRRSDLSITLSDRGVTDPPSRRAIFRYELTTRKLLACVAYKITSEYQQSSTGRIVAVPELANSYLMITFHNVYSRASPDDLRDVRREFEFDHVNLTMSGGRQFRIRGQDFVKKETGGELPGYAYAFPPGSVQP